MLPVDFQNFSLIFNDEWKEPKGKKKESALPNAIGKLKSLDLDI